VTTPNDVAAIIAADLMLDIGVRRAISLIRRGRRDSAVIALEVATYAAADALRETS